MTTKGDEDFTINIIPRNKNKNKIKDEVLDENFKKAEKKINDNGNDLGKKKKQTFLKIGIVIFIVAILCLGIIKYVPWMYINYSPTEENSENFENFYYKNFYHEEKNINQTVEKFFNSQNSSKLTGIDINDFTIVPNLSNYIFYLLGLMGIVFTAIVLVDKKKDFFSFKNLTIFHTLFSAIVAILLIYLIFVNIGFLGAQILIFKNIALLNDIFTKLILTFPASIFLIGISSFFLKICLTIIKSNFQEINKLHDKKDIRRYLEKTRYQGETRL